MENLIKDIDRWCEKYEKGYKREMFKKGYKRQIKMGEEFKAYKLLKQCRGVLADTHKRLTKIVGKINNALDKGGDLKCQDE
jgi:hypothetical protein